ncbi:ATP-dependent RNA helicase DbpA [Vibrio sp. SS-MA-C1-2]|uniref:ATP-dependent RNA helicase DbpA n=1 Tax=Vibrio sp. SS-MA-C1-2 TaxID=2908646 RepID=UPI001F42A729|nr:ATP-dependent RNA helicase DbpA [Vibrio sp. SS-MA-C1-2]UJF17764.1 ATP-dependent RNA helicase DbpA [Vibrio sp. SS-MA-C1-2]
MTQTAFSTLNLKPELLSNLSTLDYKEMTPIQAQSLPIILQHKDVIAQAKTGSGKTAAFGLGLLHNLDVKRFRIQSLVLCPTRELADQVAKEIRKLARSIHNIKVLTLCGGLPFGPQIGSLEHGAHIVVGTPGRIQDHLIKGRLDLSNLNTFVLDEADRMLEMGFQDAIDDIIEQMPTDRQTLLFSATYPPQIKSIANRIMRSPETVKAESQHSESTIKQHFYRISNDEQRLTAVRQLLMQHQPESCVIFANTKRETQQIADDLADYGFSAIGLHGDLEQRDRDQTLVRFANKSTSVLVATDVAARGLDIDALDLVINYHLSFDPEVHVHRIGRTGRAGSEGVACSLFSDKDVTKIIALEDYLGQSIQDESLPPMSVLDQPIYSPKMATLRIDGGKKQKVRPGDILGALTGDKTIAGSSIGKIHRFDFCSYVAVSKEMANQALKKLENGKIKGRQFRVWRVR